MTAAIVGVRGHCVLCKVSFELKPWQLNAIAINEPFECPYCHKGVEPSCPKQLKQFKSLDNLGLLRPSMIVLTCAALLVALVAESAVLACSAFGTASPALSLPAETAPLAILPPVTAPFCNCSVPTLPLLSVTPA